MMVLFSLSRRFFFKTWRVLLVVLLVVQSTLTLVSYAGASTFTVAHSGGVSDITITAPVSGSTLYTRTPAVLGTGIVSTIVTLTGSMGTVGTTTVSGSGTWQIDLTTSLGTGTHTICASPGTSCTTFTIDVDAGRITDSDNDGLVDIYDPTDNNIDADGDGVLDGADVDINGDGSFDGGSMSDSDGDGVHDDADVDVTGISVTVSGVTTVTDSFMDYLDDTLPIVAENSDGYTIPTSSDIDILITALDALEDRQFSAAISRAATVGFDLICLDDTDGIGEEVYCLQEQSLGGHGFYCINYQALNDHHISLPHPEHDFKTGEEGATIMRLTDARYLSISTTNRCASSTGSICAGTTSVCDTPGFKISDMAHVDDSYFHKVGEYIADLSTTSKTLQLHGCGSSSCPYTVPTSSGDHVGSFSLGISTDGSATLGVNQMRNNMQTFVDTLTSGATVGSCNLSGDANLLCGTTNTLGRYMNHSDEDICVGSSVTEIPANPRFYHIEQNLDLRRDTGGSDVLFPSSLATVINGVFGTGLALATKSDSDGDGIADAYDPIDDTADADSDGLPDYVDPNDADTDIDGDSILDGVDYDINGDGSLLHGKDININGVSDHLEVTTITTPVSGSVVYTSMPTFEGMGLSGSAVTVTGASGLIGTGVVTVSGERSTISIVSFATGTHIACVDSGASCTTFTVSEAVVLPTVEVSFQTGSIIEDGGVAVVTATLSGGVSMSDVTATFSFSGTAIAGSDYAVNTGTINISAGSTTGALVVTAIDDINVESTESIDVVLETVTNALSGDVTTGSVDIIDDDQVTVNVSISPTTGTEAGGTFVVLTELSGGAMSVDTVSIDLGFTGVAILGTDYNTSATGVMIVGGTTGAVVTLTAIQDAIVEGDEGFTVTIDSITNAVSGDVSVVGSIIDDEPVCGNGTTETGESCDDGNTTSEDGCSNVCQIEATSSGGGGSRSSSGVGGSDYCPQGDESESRYDDRCDVEIIDEDIEEESQEATDSEAKAKEENREQEEEGVEPLDLLQVYPVNETLDTSVCGEEKEEVLEGEYVADVDEEFKSALLFAYQQGITKYNNIDAFRPLDAVRRDEIAKIMVVFSMGMLCSTPDDTLSISYIDQDQADPTLVEYINHAYQLGLMRGGNGYLNPAGTITKEEFAAIIVRMMTSQYLDESGPVWYSEYVAMIKELGVATVFYPEGNTPINRHDMLLMLWRLYEKGVYVFEESENRYVDTRFVQ